MTVWKGRTSHGTLERGLILNSMELDESEGPCVLQLPASQGQPIHRVQPLCLVWFMYHSSTWNRQAKNKLEGKTATAYGKTKPQDHLQRSKLPAKPGGEDYT